VSAEKVQDASDVAGGSSPVQLGGTPPGRGGVKGEPARSAKVARLHHGRRAPHNLPAQPTRLLGRAHEVADLHRRLLDPHVRLLTLTGPGGTGKSRLALEAAAAAAEAFADGVVFVDLVPVREATLVPETIIRVLHAREEAHTSALDTLVEAVHDQQMLLVLDNFEQVLAAAPSIAELVATCPHVTVLITSRAPLRVRWEHEVPVAPLDVPGSGSAGDLDTFSHSPAVALFVQRAQAVRPDFTLDADNAADVASICARVQGMPLAIELAAARVRVLSPRALLARLARAGASPTLDLLSGGASDLPGRQRSLRDTIAWSYDLLTPVEQLVFRRLTVFSGGWTLDAAEAVCAAAADQSTDGTSTRSGDIAAADVLDAMLSLVEKSLLVRLSGSDGEPRFTMLEAMQEFGHEQLAADEKIEVRHAHARVQLAFARATARQLTGPAQSRSVQQLEREHHNLRSALEWSLTGGDSDVALRLCAALTMFWYIRGHYREGRGWCSRALAAAAGASPQTRAAVLHGAASLADIQHDRAEARSLIDASVAAWRAAGSGRGLASSLSMMGMLARHEGDRELARRSCTEALVIYETAPDPWGERLALGVLGWLAEDEGDHATAQQLLEASLDKAREARSPTDIALQLNNLGIVALRQGDDDVSEAHHVAALTLTRQVDAHEPMACALEGLAAVAASRGDHMRAAWLVGAATALRSEISSPRIAQFDEEHRRLLPKLYAALGDDAFARAAGEGAAAVLDDVVVVALDTGDRREPGGARPASGRHLGGPRSPGAVVLTSRQAAYLRLLAEGCTNRAIARALVVSETAVEQMLVRLYVRIGVRNRAEAVRYAYEHGLA
jgi:non-specific serine/threonine protein kinase